MVSDKDKKVQEEKVELGNDPEASEGKEYDEEWDLLDKEDAETKDGDSGPGDDVPIPEIPGEDQASDEGADKKKEVSEHHGSVESLEKALNDTKTYANTLKGERDELQKKLREFEEGKATAKDVDDARKSVQDAKDNLDEIKAKVYEDYPELKDLLDPLIATNRNLSKEITDLKHEKEEGREKRDKQAKIDDFNNNIKPKILEKHENFDAIMRNPDYWSWAEKQRPALRTAAMDSPDPQDIVWALNEFKVFKASDKADDLKKRDQETRNQKLTNAQSLRGGASQFTPKREGEDPNDYSGGWNEAGKVLKEEGLA